MQLFLPIIFISLVESWSTQNTTNESNKTDLQMKNVTNETTVIEKGGEGNETAAVVTSIFDLCLLFQIPKETCTCKNLPDFCDGEDTYNPTLPPVHTNDETLTNWYAIYTIVISVIGIFPNLFVVIVTVKFSKEMNRSNILIAILSFNDMIFSMLYMMYSVPLFWTVEWIYGDVMCRVLRGVEFVTAALCIIIMLVIAIDRFLVLIFQLRVKYPVENVTYITLAIGIIITIASTVPYVIAVKIDPESGRCYEQWKDGKSALLAYQWYIMIVFYIIPVILISITYGYLMKYLTEQLTSSVVVTERMLKKRLKDSRRIMKVLLSITIAFITFTLPNKVFWIYVSSKESVDQKVHDAFAMVALVTLPIHSVINPFIYSVVDKGFRKNLSQMTVEKIKRISATESSVVMDDIQSRRGVSS